MAQPGDSEPPPGTSYPHVPEPPPETGAGKASTARYPTFVDLPGAPPASRADGGMWMLFALLGFAAGEIVAYLFVAIAAALAGEEGQLPRLERLASPPEWYVGTSLVGLWVGFLLGPWVASRARGTGRLFADLGVRFRPVDAVGIVIGIGAQLLVGLAYAPFIHNTTKFGAPTTRLTGASHGLGFLVIAVLTVVGAPFFEELFFRGLVFKALARLFVRPGLGPCVQRTFGLVAAVVLDGLLFGLAHAEWEQFAGLAAFGMVLAVISYRTNRLGMNMVSHATFNLVAVVAVLHSRGAAIY